RINWAQLARVMHVSKEIVWISPVVDLCFFLLIGFGGVILSRIFPRLPALRVLAFLLIFLTAYDWLMLTGHFYRRAALIFALGAAVAFNRWFGKRQQVAVRVWSRSVLWLILLLSAAFVGIEGGKWIHE